MSETTKPLRIFVAMPGDLGRKSRYSSSASVKTNFLDPIRDGVERRLQRSVSMFIEKEKITTGDIHASMFKEAVEADVYIADLTNANPNVYLELGVRWALRDGLTIPIYQNPDDLRFNVGSTRAFQYTPDNMTQQIAVLVDMIAAYQEVPRIDSPVRDRMELISVTRMQLQSLEEEIGRLKASRGEDLYKAAASQTDSAAKADLLMQAVRVNPAYTDALLELGVLQREMSDYAESEQSLQQARRLEPQRAEISRELGVTYSKCHRLAEAIQSLRFALQYDDKDAEAWSNLGGALRRDGMQNGGPEPNRTNLEAARDAYHEASRLAPTDLYAALNVCRLDLVLARWEPARLKAAIDEFRRRRPLCEWQANEAPDDYWRKFDLAEALLFTADRMVALAAYRTALESVPKGKQSDTLRSVREPLKGYLDSGVLSPELAATVAMILGELPSPN